MTNSNRKYRIGGYRPGTIPDSAKHHQIGRFQTENLPPKVDLRQYMTTVEQQVGNSCVANAFVGAYEYLAKRTLGDSADVSRLFVYYNARAQHDSEKEDSGTQMNAAIAALTKYGACAEELWPNDEAMLFDEPDETAYDQAANFTIEEAELIETDLDLWRHTLAEGNPIAFALNTFQSFDEATSNRGRVPLPKKSDNVRETHGWHAMLCVGYSDKDRMFTVRNSWGEEWGDRGYCYIPYDYVIHPDYNGHDSWIIKSISDLDFSEGVWEEGTSWFAGEGEILFSDFYITTQDPEGFAEALDALCQEYVDSVEDYYFDYQYDDEDEDASTVDILSMNLTLDDPSEFLEALEALCEEYAIDGDYEFHLEGEDEEGGDDEDDEDDEDDDDEDDEDGDDYEDDEDEDDYEENDEDEDGGDDYEDEEGEDDE